MRNKISIGTLLILMTSFVMAAAVYRVSASLPIAGAILLFAESVLGVFLLYGLMFCIAYPLGRLEKYVSRHAPTSDSPFATDRLPSQILPPTDRAGE